MIGCLALLLVGCEAYHERTTVIAPDGSITQAFNYVYLQPAPPPDDERCATDDYLAELAEPDSNTLQVLDRTDDRLLVECRVVFTFPDATAMQTAYASPRLQRDENPPEIFFSEDKISIRWRGADMAFTCPEGNYPETCPESFASWDIVRAVIEVDMSAFNVETNADRREGNTFIWDFGHVEPPTTISEWEKLERFSYTPGGYTQVQRAEYYVTLTKKPSLLERIRAFPADNRLWIAFAIVVMLLGGLSSIGRRNGRKRRKQK